MIYDIRVLSAFVKLHRKKIHKENSYLCLTLVLRMSVVANFYKNR